MKRITRWSVPLLCGAWLLACSAEQKPEWSALTSSRLGSSVAYLELTGDDRIDRVVAAPEASSPDVERCGALFIYEGHADGTFSSNPRVVYGPHRGARFGSNIWLVGDLDGGGKDDLVIGAPLVDGAVTDSGSVYICHGERPDDLVQLQGVQSGSRFGQALAAGDFDGDGARDLAVGAHRTLDPTYQAGTVYVFLGADGMEGAPDVVLADPSVRRAFGTALLASDFNGDGMDDLFVAGSGAHVSVYFGAARFQPVATAPNVMVMAWPSTFDATGAAHVASSYGATMARLGDLNGDGIDEVAIANPRRSTHDLYDNKGLVHVFRGAAELPAVIHQDSVDENTVAYRLGAIVGHRNQDRFGTAIVALGDVDGHGTPDFAVGAPWANTGAPIAGAVYVFYGEQLADYTHAGVAPRILIGSEPGARFGEAMTWNGADLRLFVGAPDALQYQGATFDLSIEHDAINGVNGSTGGGHAH